MDETQRIITAREICRPEPGASGLLLRAPFVAVDVETTGTSAESRIVEIAGARFAPDGTLVDEFSSLANPGANVPLSPAAEAVHGITAAQVRAAPPIAEVLAQFREFVGSDGLVAHNLAFENRLMSAAYLRLDSPPPNWQGVCTLKAARTHFQAASNKLTSLIELFELDAINTHRALDDARACGMLLAAMMQRRNLTDLVPLPAATEPAPRSESTITVSRPGGSPDGSEMRAAFGGHAPTEEQSSAMRMFQEGNQLKITAVAGSGKSSTLLGIARLEAQRNPARRGLYLAFNRSVAKEASGKFPQQVQASTAHSLAYRHIRTTSYGPLLTKLDAPLATWKTVISAVGAEKLWLTSSGRPRPLSDYTIARLSMGTVEQFCQSTDEKIGPHHVPLPPGVEGADRAALQDKVMRCARRAWANLLDPNKFEVRFTPSHYLKMWAMTGPRVGREGDYLLFDEAQDANPILRDLVLQQEHLQTVFVGDSAQAIYGFTGAVDSLKLLPGRAEATLTQSWRFGPVVADAANQYLELLDTGVRVRGNPGRDSVLIDDHGAVDAVLCRTNADAIAEVMAAQKANVPTALEGDVRAALRFCESAEKLMDGRSPQDPALMAFSSWSDLGDYAENAPGASEIKVFYDLIEEHGVDAVRNTMNSLVNPRQAQLSVLTCHKSKGLEYPRVRVNRNWEIDPEDHQGAGSEAELQNEYRLAYVALTRAMDGLDPGMLLNPQQKARAASARGDHPGGALFSLSPTG